METTQFALVTLWNGDKTLRSLQHNETFHPIGPLVEAKLLHVDQQQLASRSQNYEKFILWDVGLGAAANSIAAIESLQSKQQNSTTDIEIHSFDLNTDSLQFALAHAVELGYILPYREKIAALIMDGFVQLGPRLKWYFHLGDFCTQMERKDLPKPHSVFYDPYSPATNCEMWTLSHLQKFRYCLGEDCILTSYSRSTSVRVTFLLAGFFAGAGCEIGNKAETTIFATQLSLLERPLQKAWLGRVRISGNAAPMRGPAYSKLPIAPTDYAVLETHTQFQ